MCNVFASERRQKHLNPLIKTGENTENIFKLQLEHYFTTMIGWITTKKFQVEVLFSPPCRQAWGTEPGGERVKVPCRRSNTSWLSNRWMNNILQYWYLMSIWIKSWDNQNSCNRESHQSYLRTKAADNCVSNLQDCSIKLSLTHSLVHFELNLTCLIILREAVPSAWPSRTILRGSVSLASQTFRGKIHFYIFVQLKNVLFLRVRHLF